ncbi:DUF4062 domain-containing protein [Candidatus Acetothermia bacterium]|jgi:hypothetical protein|nr:DUF4062 domain-containing protein [Candidatus Acetothermia bacterium]
MSKLKVFVSSSQTKRELEYDREIAKIAILELQLEPVMFEGLSARSKDRRAVYIDEVKNCDIFVLILWKTLRPAVKKEFDEAISNNRPILIFVKTLHCGEERDADLRKFLHGIQGTDRADWGESVPYIPFYVHYDTLRDLKKRMKEGIIAEISRMLAREPISTYTRQELYELGTRITRQARRQLFLFEQTPCLVFGPREYGQPINEALFYEKEYYLALQEWIELVDQDTTRQFLYFFNAQATKEEVQKHPNPSQVKETLVTLKEKEKQTGERFRLIPSPPNYSGPIALGDNWFAFWLVGEADAVTISFVNEKVSDAVSRNFHQMGSRRISLEKLLKDLKLNF